MNRWIVLALKLTLMTAFSTLKATPPERMDRAVVIVGDQVVLESELKEQTKVLHQLLASQGMAEKTSTEQICKQARDLLIWEKILSSLMEQYPIQVPPAEIDRAIERYAAQAKLSVPELLQQAIEQGSDEETLRAMFKKQIELTTLQELMVRDRIHITEEERAQLKQDLKRKKEARYAMQLSHILIPIREEGNIEEQKKARKQANEIYERLQRGESFSNLAITYSAGPEALQGGSMGWKQPEELPSVFAEKLLRKPVGTITKPFQTGVGFHLLKIEAIQDKNPVLVEEYHLKHILLRSQETKDSHTVEQELKQLAESLRRGEKNFDEVAREISEDTSSAVKGGDLGWAPLEIFDPEFAQAAKGLNIGEISDPVATPFGWHLVMCLGKRTQDRSEEALDQEVFSLLVQRKLAEAQEQWRQEQLAQTHIEIIEPLS